MSRAAQMANRAALLGCGLLAVLLLAAPAGASPKQAGELQARSADAGVSIINGRTTTIKDWPWQVALTFSRKSKPRWSTSRRFFCGGSALTPRLVITAGHCVADFKQRQLRSIEIVSGRTNLNSNQGRVARVVGLSMPRNKAGKRLYRTRDGTADWDVALLRVSAPMAVEPIKLAGSDEAATWAPGQTAWTTGWGVTRAFSRKVPPNLRLAKQVIMGDALCQRSEGNIFRATTMLCAGGPKGTASTCSGDSGGPLVVGTSDGYRLVGVTSFGDGACRPNVPSVDTRVSGELIRKWIAETAMKMTGQDVVGTEAEAATPGEWCRIPAVFRLTPAKARERLEKNGCRLGRVRTDPWAGGPRGRIIGYSRYPGWLAPLGYRLDVWLAP